MGLNTADWVLLMFRMALGTGSSVASAFERKIQTTTEKMCITVNVSGESLAEYLRESCRQDFAWHVAMHSGHPAREMVQELFGN